MVEDEKDGCRASARAEPEQREQSINALVPPERCPPSSPLHPDLCFQFRLDTAYVKSRVSGDINKWQ